MLHCPLEWTASIPRDNGDEIALVSFKMKPPGACYNTSIEMIPTTLKLVGDTETFVSQRMAGYDSSYDYSRISRVRQLQGLHPRPAASAKRRHHIG